MHSLSKPLGEVNDVYKEPITLELPQSESAISIGSSLSSGRSVKISASLCQCVKENGVIIGSVQVKSRLFDVAVRSGQ